MIGWWIVACAGGPELEPASSRDYSGIIGREEGWFRGDLHVHTDYDGGFEDVATVIALAESLESEPFVASHPEFLGNGLDYLAITDHRNVTQEDAEGYASERLVLVGGEELGSRSHAGLHGVHAFVDHDPDGDGNTLDDLQAAVEATHAQGGVFSPNHPFLPDLSWPWATRGHDGVEIWNGGWALMAPASTLEDLARWEAKHGAASSLYVRALQTQGRTSSMQTLTWYEAQLATGRHAAMIGGSDRHAVLLPGFPTTWIQADAADEVSLVDGIRARHTFISRTPVGAQLLLEVEAGGVVYGLGDEVPIDGDASRLTLRVVVARGEGGLLQIRGGDRVEETEILEADLGVVMHASAVDGDVYEVKLDLIVDDGDWLYPMVYEPLVAPGLTDDEAAAIRTLAAEVAATSAEDFLGLATLFTELVDGTVLIDASRCDVTAWEPERLQCMPQDSEGLASFYVPDRLDRALNAVLDDGELTDWCMGAVGSGLRFVVRR